MTLLEIDITGEVTRLTLEAETALGRGETARAGVLFEQAATKLKSAARRIRPRGERDAGMYLAATQYVKGGSYEEALHLCRRIEASKLPANVKHSFPAFFEKIKERASPDYKDRARGRLVELWKTGEYQAVLRALQEDPFLLSQSALAYLRAVCCEERRDYRTAALFYADAVRFAPDDPGLFEAAAALPLQLLSQGKLAEGWEYVQHQLELLPHPLTHVNAALFCFARAVEETRPNDLIAQQLAHHEAAVEGFRRLPAAQQSLPALRAFLALSFEGAALGLHRLGREEAALEQSNQAVEFAPDAPGPLTIRAMLTYPSAQAVQDCRQAAERGERSYIPYYFLGHHALAQGEYPQAEAFCTQALARTPSQPVRAQLLGWRAICRSHLGETRGAVRELFREAQELDPGNERIRANREAFESWSQNGNVPFLVFVSDRVEPPSFDHLRPLQGDLEQGSRRRDCLTEQLMGGAA